MLELPLPGRRMLRGSDVVGDPRSDLAHDEWSGIGDPMSDTPWTPGPWEPQADNFGDGDGWQMTVSPVERGPKLDMLAILYGDGNPATQDEIPEREIADARLIAAAPEMAELLAEALDEAIWVANTAEGLHGRISTLLARIRGEDGDPRT